MATIDKAALGGLIDQSKRNRPAPNNAGFMLGKVRCRGLLTSLKDRFYPNFNKRKINMRFTKKKANGMRVGDLFHRQVYHYFKCSNTTTLCACTKRFKRRTANIRKNTIHYERLQALKQFLSEAQWQVFDCELVAGYKDHKIATAVDLVCVDSLVKPGQLFVVELKFGYERGLDETTSALPKLQWMVGEAGQYVKDTFANHHQLQLWFEMEAIEKTYGLRCSGGAVVYIRDGPRPKKGETRKCTYHARYAASWWFRDAKMRENLLRQLLEINVD